jgi:hypothetical protein
MSYFFRSLFAWVGHIVVCSVKDIAEDCSGLASESNTRVDVPSPSLLVRLSW